MASLLEEPILSRQSVPALDQSAFAVSRPAPPAESPLSSYHALDLRELVLIAWRRKWCFVVCIGISLAVGWAYLAQADRVYEVKTRLLVERQQSPLNTNEPQRLEKDLNFLATQAQIISSPAVVAKAAEACDWPTSRRSRTTPAKGMVDALTVRPVMGTSVLSVSFKATRATRAVEGVNAIIESYRQYLSDVERTSHSENLVLLTRSEKDLRSDLQQLETQYGQLRKRSPLTGNGKRGGDVQLALVEQLGRKLADIRQRRVELENQVQVATDSTPDTKLTSNESAANAVVYASFPARSTDIGEVLEQDGDVVALEQSSAAYSAAARQALPPAAQLLPAGEFADALDIHGMQRQLIEARMSEKNLLERFGYKHPEVRAVREQIADLAKQVDDAIVAIPNLLRRELEFVQGNEGRVAELYAGELDKAKAIDVYVLEEQQLLGQIARVQSLHDSIHQQLRHSELTDQAAADGRSAVRVTVLDPPVRPFRPVWPAPAILFATCAAIGLVGGLGLVTFAEQRASNIQHGSAT